MPLKEYSTFFENRLIFQLPTSKSATARPGDQLNGFENGKTQLFNSWGVGELAYFVLSVHLMNRTI